MGTTRRLKELNPKIRCISLQPDSSFHGLEGLKHMATAIVPPIYDASLADENMEVHTEDAQRMAKRLAREEGIAGGRQRGRRRSGRAWKWRGGSEARERAVIVTVFPDSGEKYLSERFWSEE